MGEGSSILICGIDILYSFLFRINNSLPCWDLNPGPPGTKQIAYQSATVLGFCKAWLPDLIGIEFYIHYMFVFVLPVLKELTQSRICHQSLIQRNERRFPPSVSTNCRSKRRLKN